MRRSAIFLSFTLGGWLVSFAADRPALAAQPYDGGTYVQNFDTLPNAPENTSLETATGKWQDDTTPSAGVFSIPGWYLYHPLTPASESGTNGHQRLRAGPGTQNTGGFWSFGATGTTERALGDIGSTTVAQNPGAGNIQDMYIALRLTNNTNETLRQFTLSYTGEQWRNGGNANLLTDSWMFDYSLDPAATVNSGVYTRVPSLDFVTPTVSTTAAALDGNDPANRAVKSDTITGIVWRPGTDLWLRWDDLQISGNDHGLGIDDLSFSASPVPEPASMLLIGLGGAALLRRRR